MLMVVSFTCKRTPVWRKIWPATLLLIVMAFACLNVKASASTNGCRDGFSDYKNTIYACNVLIAKPGLSTPQMVRALQVRAQALIVANRPADAVRDYTSAIERLPKGRLQGYLLYLRGRTNLEYLNGQVGQGTRDLEAANTLAPGNTRILEALAGAYYGQARYQEAITISTQAIDADPRSVVARKIRAQANENIGKAFKALVDLDMLLIQMPRDYDLLVWRARIHYTRNNSYAALADYRKAARIKTTDEILAVIARLERILDK